MMFLFFQNNRVAVLSIIVLLCAFGLTQGVFSADTAVFSCPPGTEQQSTVCVPTSTATGLSNADPATIIGGLVKWLLGFVGALAVLMVIIGGIMYVTSGGEESRIDTAKRILMWAIIGLIVALLGWVIVSTVVNAL